MRKVSTADSGRIQKRPSGQRDSVPVTPHWRPEVCVSSSTTAQMKHSLTTVAGTVELSHTMSRESQRGGLAGFRDTHLPPPTARRRRNRTGVYVQVFTHRATQREPVRVQDSPTTAAGACGAQNIPNTEFPKPATAIRGTAGTLIHHS